MEHLFTVALAVFAISVTLTTSVMLEGLRKWIKARSEFFGKLVYCPYCASHWIAFALVGAEGWHGVLAFIVQSFATIGLAALMSYAYIRAQQ